MWHTIVVHSLTSTHTINFIRIKQPTKNLLWTKSISELKDKNMLWRLVTCCCCWWVEITRWVRGNVLSRPCDLLRQLRRNAPALPYSGDCHPSHTHSILRISSRHIRYSGSKNRVFSLKGQRGFAVFIGSQLLHCVSKNVPLCQCPLSLPNIQRFSKFFHWHTSYTICNNAVTKYPTTA